MDIDIFPHTLLTSFLACKHPATGIFGAQSYPLWIMKHFSAHISGGKYDKCSLLSDFLFSLVTVFLLLVSVGSSKNIERRKWRVQFLDSVLRVDVLPRITKGWNVFENSLAQRAHWGGSCWERVAIHFPQYSTKIDFLFPLQWHRATNFYLSVDCWERTQYFLAPLSERQGYVVQFWLTGGKRRRSTYFRV